MSCLGIFDAGVSCFADFTLAASIAVLVNCALFYMSWLEDCCIVLASGVHRAARDLESKVCKEC